STPGRAPPAPVRTVPVGRDRVTVPPPRSWQVVQAVGQRLAAQQVVEERLQPLLLRRVCGRVERRRGEGRRGGSGRGGGGGRGPEVRRRPAVSVRQRHGC